MLVTQPRCRQVAPALEALYTLLACVQEFSNSGRLVTAHRSELDRAEQAGFSRLEQLQLQQRTALCARAGAKHMHLVAKRAGLRAAGALRVLAELKFAEPRDVGMLMGAQAQEARDATAEAGAALSPAAGGRRGGRDAEAAFLFDAASGASFSFLLY